MKVLHAVGVNNALPLGLKYLRDFGREEPSRVGPVVVSSCPVTTVYMRPKQHVLFSSVRNANPFFHMLESLWMLAGRNDVAFPAHYAAQMQLYSDDNETLNGAYGFRWRAHFGYDQLSLIIDELRKNPASRRCVLAMWDAMEFKGTPPRPYDYEGDLNRGISGGADIPCNTHVYFRVNQGRLDMTVCNRSNDAVWGAYGANAVHFALMQEYVALAVGVKQGDYYQVANNFHYYRDREDVKRLINNLSEIEDDRYNAKKSPVRTLPLFEDRATFDAELPGFISGPTGASVTEPFLKLAQLLAIAHAQYKGDNLPLAISTLRAVGNVDWAVAGVEWLERVAVKRAAGPTA